MAEPMRPEVRYTAFLSYSHKDAAAAGRLHRRLEAYRLPKRLAGSQAARGPVPERLWPIFRDREELPAATDLSETVREALAQSGALIVLCSPHSAESLWVAEEIETFRRLHPDRPILAAILDGDPPDCFPAALRAFGRDGTWHEPLATDLRPQGDGAHLGLLKLVAGITGVGLDALVQRDAARRIRRVMAVTGAALIAMLIMAALAVVALNALREAERQRAEAEGLVEFMLTDLREKLRGVGRLDIMTAVNERALAYYGEQEELDELSPESLERRARVLLAMGEDDVARGNLPAALGAFREAHRTTDEQLARAPADPNRIFAHAQSEYWVGRVHELRRDWPAARRQYMHYAAAAERLIAVAPGNPDYMMEVGWGAQNLGVVQLEGLHDAVAAQASFTKATRWFERAVAARPGEDAARRELANAFGWLADSFYARRLWQDSLAARLEQYRITERLFLADPANVEIAYRLAVAERSVARLSALAGNRADVRPFMRKAYDRAHWLTARDPRNVQWLLLRAKVECDMLSRSLALGGGVSERRLRESIRDAVS
ncbi:MAG TPA: toll/interleukin-1 receptor domain-containing protein, partial [Allosphingosinicella sp.]|nr:toll/interleukin-1 receptor domain-containing protein [Allosphingosinicella sp.]